MRRARFALEAAVFGAAIRLAAFLPRRALLAIGAALGSLACRVDREHTRIAIANLRAALGPAVDEEAARRIARDCWRHFGRIVLDALAFPRLDAAASARLVRCRGLEDLRAAYARGKGVLLFSAHYGHWELGAVAQGHLGFPLAVVTRPLDNPRLERILARLRGRSGNVIIHKRNAVREVLKALRAGIGVAIVIDQDARDQGVFVPFLGRPASTTPTLALLALRTGAAVVPVRCVPLSGGTWELAYGPEVAVEDTGDRDSDVLALTARCTAIVEGWVRERPDLWLWMHRRWKTAPPGGMTEA